MLPNDDVATVRRWAGLHRREHVDVIVDDDGSVTVTGSSGATVARLVWMEERHAWRLLTVQQGSLRIDPLAAPTTDIEDLLPTLGIDASERLLG